jgi:hypothetical protein
MPLSWRSSTQPSSTPRSSATCAAILLALVAASLPSFASAQLGRRLAVPGHDVALGQRLGDPAGEETAPSLSARPSAPGWVFDLSATTSLPLSVGLEAVVQSPVGITAHLSAGHTPSAYLGMMSAMLRDAGVYSANLDPIVNEATGSGAWNVRLGLGYTIPEGFEVGVGYTVLTGTSAITPAAIESATRQRFPWPGMSEVPLSLTTHAIHARVGWRFLVEEHFVLRIAVGWTHSFATEAHLDVPPELRLVPNDPATKIERAVREGFGRYGFTPEVLVSAGYRF